MGRSYYEDDRIDPDDGKQAEEFIRDQDEAYGENEEEESQQLTGFGAADAQMPNFDDGAYKYAKMLGISKYLIDLRHAILKLKITTDYQTALIRCGNALFSQEVLMGNASIRKSGFFGRYDPLYYMKIDARKAILLTRTHATQHDLQVISAKEIEDQIMFVFEAYASRSVGMKRERLINNELRTYSTSATESLKYSDPASQIAQKRGGFLSGIFSGGRKQ